MKNYLIIFKYIISCIFLSALAVNGYGQCPVPGTCTFTATSGTNYTVNAGQTLCINSPTNYSSGTITLNGGTVYVASGATLGVNISPSSASVINNCGTLNSANTYNANVTINNYSTSALNLSYAGQLVNNYANSATISFSNVNSSSGGLNNFATGLNFSITGSWNNGITINNNIGASMTVTAVPGGSMPASTVFNNTGVSFTYSPTVNTTGATFNNASGSTFNFLSAASANSAKINNNGTMNVTGTYYLAGNTITNNGTLNVSGEFRLDGGTLNMGTNSTTTVNTLYKNNGSISMGDHSLLNIVQNVTTWSGSAISLTSGCASIMGSTLASSTSIGSNFIGNSNINFCGAPPAQTSGCTNPISTLNNNGSGLFRITIPTCGTMPVDFGYVQIYNATYTNLNGLWRVRLIAANTYDLIGSVYNASATTAGSRVISEQSKIFIGLGTSNYLGYASCANPCMPLPVTFLYFKARLEGKNTLLNWASEKEEDNKLFIVQRSKDGINFTDLNAHEGAGNSNGTLFYNDLDYNTPNGVSYYRIKMIDSKGVVTFSTIESVTNRGENIFEIYPNPSNGNFTISWEDNGEQDQITVAVIDVTGNIVRNYETDFSAKSINISSLPDGLYLVEIKTTSTKVVKKVIVGL